MKPDVQSLSGNVRGLIERENRARALPAAARAYQRFLEETQDERAAMETWESAPLVDAVEFDKP